MQGDSDCLINFTDITYKWNSGWWETMMWGGGMKNKGRQGEVIDDSKLEKMLTVALNHCKSIHKSVD
jgi:hypothetical protein